MATQSHQRKRMPRVWLSLAIVLTLLSAVVVSVRTSEAQETGTGKFRLIKHLSPDYIEVPPGESFVFRYTCHKDQHELPEKVLVIDYTTSNRTESEELPAGYTCLIREDKPLFSAEGYVWRPGDIPPVVIEQGKIKDVEVTNKFVIGPAWFEIRKEIVVPPGLVIPQDQVFEFEYSCDGDREYGDPIGPITMRVPLNAPLPVRSGDIPNEHTCTVTEKRPQMNLGNFEWVPPPAQTVTVDAFAGVQRLEFTNHFIPKTGPATGTFSVHKVVTGVAELPENHEFQVRYSCVAPDAALNASAEIRTMTLKNNQTQESEPLPVGTTCTLMEDISTATIPGGEYRLNPPQFEPSEVVTIRDPAEGAQTVQLTNHYVRNTGAFQVKKIVNVDGARRDTDDIFTINWQCGAKEGQLVVAGNGTLSSPVSNIPINEQCRLTEESAERSGYSHAVGFDHQTFTVTDPRQPLIITSTSNYIRNKGGFSLAKEVAGDAQALAPRRFDFTYTCVGDDAAKTVVTDTVSVAAGSAATISDIPTGECEITENAGDIDNATRTTTFSVNGSVVPQGEKVRFRVPSQRQPEPTVKIKAVNTYTAAVAKISVRKNVVSDGDTALLAAKNYNISYTCQPAYTGAFAPKGEILVVKGNGSLAETRELPIGTRCTFTELDAQHPGYSWQKPQDQTVSVATAAMPEVVFTNTYSRSVGSFAIAKKVTGLIVLDNDEGFSFNYRCTLPNSTQSTGRISAKADGVPVAVPVVFPVGTTCVVSEDTKKAARSGFIHKAPNDVFFTIEQSDANNMRVITMENSYFPWLAFLVPAAPIIMIPLLRIIRESILSPNGKPTHKPGTAPPAPDKGIDKNPTISQQVSDGSAGNNALAYAPKGQNQPKRLASTGSPAVGIIALAIIMCAIGVITIRRGRVQ